MRLLLLLLGIASIMGSIALIAVPLYGVFNRGTTDSAALNAWNHGGSSQLVGPVPGAPAPPGGSAAPPPACGSGAPGDYALVNFPTLSRYGYAGVAGNGTWDELLKRSMVHYQGTAAPGDQGNVIIGFHREPDFEHIDELHTGDTVSVQDRTCKTFIYRVSQRWELDPAKVTQLDATTGHDLTLVTCTPWFQDYNRIVWRAELVTE
jgi:sortase A